MPELYTPEELREVFIEEMKRCPYNQPLTAGIMSCKESTNIGPVTFIGLVGPVLEAYEITTIAKRILDAAETDIFRIQITEEFTAPDLVHKILASAIAHSKGNISFTASQMNAHIFMGVVFHYAQLITGE